jgi:hypothetical protein
MGVGDEVEPEVAAERLGDAWRAAAGALYAAIGAHAWAHGGFVARPSRVKDEGTPSVSYQGERMTRTIPRRTERLLGALCALGLLISACGAASCADRTAAVDAGTPVGSAEMKPAPIPEPSAASSVAPSTASSVASPVAPEATASGALSAKKFDCGSKEKPCPMQGWMKRVMAPAASAGEGPALAAALTYVEKHVPPGFDTWASISSEGAKKAKAGDVAGAKASCKQCHDAYKAQYKATMRDRPF